jgi:hypothetical protein
VPSPTPKICAVSTNPIAFDTREAPANHKGEGVTPPHARARACARSGAPREHAVAGRLADDSRHKRPFPRAG